MIWWTEDIKKFLGLKMEGDPKNMGGLKKHNKDCKGSFCAHLAHAVGQTEEILQLYQAFSNTELILADLCTSMPGLAHRQLKGTLFQGI